MTDSLTEHVIASPTKLEASLSLAEGTDTI